MELKKLIIHGFKSFADTVEVSFEKGITGIVGPNGCGKSNIGEAVKWVLGEQNPRLLRGAKMEDVIFNGTEKRRRLSFCEVTLIFDNTDGALPIDYAEVSVSRRAYRSGDGEYQINGTDCRLRDVVELFRDTGLGRDGYSIVGQGMIDDILSQKSEERREVFEEAAGIRKIKVRRLEAGKKLDNTMANLERVDDIIGELNERIEPLRQQSEQARRYLSLREELKTLELNVFLVRYVKYEARLKELNEQIEEFKRDNEALSGRLTEHTGERDGLQGELDGLEITSAALRDSVQERIKLAEQSEGAYTLLNERLSNAQREKERAENELKAASGDEESIKLAIEELNKELDDLKKEAADSDSALAQQGAELEKKAESLTEEETRSEQLKRELIDKINRASDTRSSRARLTALTGALSEQIDQLTAEVERLKKSFEALSSHHDTLEGDLSDELAKLREIAEKAKRLSDEGKTLTAERDSLNETLQQMRNDIKASETRLHMLKELQRDYDGYNNSVKQVLIRFRPGTSDGAHGVVADLIKVQERIERAIDMALGASLQHIVVDRDEDAKRMIEYLRVNRYGRATFLPIDSIRGRVMRREDRHLLNTPGCVGLASELVECDNEYREIINNLLGYTIIAEDLDTGIAIRRSGGNFYRIVTLQGDVMHSGGSMTGGSIQSRASSLLSRSREISSEESRLRALNESVERTQKEYTDAVAKLMNAREEYTLTSDIYHEQEIVCERARVELRSADDEVASLKSRIEEIDSNIDRLTLQRSEANDQLSLLSETREIEQTDTEKLNGEINELQERIFGMRESLNEEREKYTQASVANAALHRRRDEAAKQLDSFISRLGNIDEMYAEGRKQLEESAGEIDRLTLELSEALKSGEEAKQKLDEARKEFAANDARRTGILKRIREINTHIDQTRDQYDVSTESLNRAMMQLQRIESDSKQLTDRIFEDYELTYAGAEQYRVKDFALSESEKRASSIKAEIRRMGTVNVASIDEYRSTSERLNEYNSQREDLSNAIDDVSKVIRELEQSMKKQFLERFALMSEYFTKSFSALFSGGTARLELADRDDPLNCGIEIIAQPPGKKLQSLMLLSGGERALTAVAILFAMLEIKPTPFCILDEIEAALDDANIDSFAEFLKVYSKRTQFVVVTHRKGTMERCDSLYGVVMEEKGVSKLISVTLKDALKEA